MKLRLNDSSIRLRLRRSEVEQLAEAGAVAFNTRFPGGPALRVRLSAGEVPGATVSFSGDEIAVRVPAPAAAAWLSSADVGIYGEQEGLEIVVEKDFRRSSGPSPDDADRYPNPRAHA